MGTGEEAYTGPMAPRYALMFYDARASRFLIGYTYRAPIRTKSCQTQFHLKTKNKNPKRKRRSPRRQSPRLEATSYFVFIWFAYGVVGVAFVFSIFSFYFYELSNGHERLILMTTLIVLETTLSRLTTPNPFAISGVPFGASVSSR